MSVDLRVCRYLGSVSVSRSEPVSPRWVIRLLRLSLSRAASRVRPLCGGPRGAEPEYFPHNKNLLVYHVRLSYLVLCCQTRRYNRSVSSVELSFYSIVEICAAHIFSPFRSFRSDISDRFAFSILPLGVCLDLITPDLDSHIRFDRFRALLTLSLCQVKGTME